MDKQTYTLEDVDIHQEQCPTSISISEGVHISCPSFMLSVYLFCNTVHHAKF